jgi:hypothetical protein
MSEQQPTTEQVQAALDEYRRVFAHGVTPHDYLVNGVVDLERLGALRKRKLALLHTMTGLMGNANSIATMICDAQLDHAGSWRVDQEKRCVFCVQCVVARSVRTAMKGSVKR